MLSKKSVESLDDKPISKWFVIISAIVVISLYVLSGLDVQEKSKKHDFKKSSIVSQVKNSE